MEAVVVAATGPHEVAARGHVVQFYRHGEELADWAGGYLSAGVADGGVAVIIATPEHRLAFEKRLTEAGLDVPAAVDRGDYLELDAERTVHRLVTGGRLDRARFELVIGDLIHQATSAGRPVRVFGELVAVLWQAGRVRSAVELEELWNGLGRRYPFGLWCGYPAVRAADRHLTDAVTEVCRHHSMVIGEVPVPRHVSKELARSGGTFSRRSWVGLPHLSEAPSRKEPTPRPGRTEAQPPRRAPPPLSRLSVSNYPGRCC